MNGIYHLKGRVKHYDWGGFSFIPSLLELENKEKKPFAEYWLGTHPQGNSQIEMDNGQFRDLQEQGIVLPYLLKVLDVKDMLSIQVHPSKPGASKEFAKENLEGIPLDSPERNYKDDNHKPELMVALSDFWLLHGFKPVGKMTDILTSEVDLNELLPVFDQSGYKGLYQKVMEMPQEEVNRILRPLLKKIIPLYQENKLDKNSENFWAARAALVFSHLDTIDRGIFSIYFFNLLQLTKEEGVFQDAGLPHAYLEGQCVEIMASSDNVLRGGLTHKHIDVKELLKHVKCEPTVVKILAGELDGDEKIYPAAVTDFRLSEFSMNTGEVISLSVAGIEIFLLTEGLAEFSHDHIKLELKHGTPSAIAFPGQKIHLIARSKATVFRASLPSTPVDK